MEIYEVYFDHQIEGERLGTFSSLDKAKKYLFENQKCDPKTEKKSTKKWFFSNVSGLHYSIEEKTVF